MAFDDLPPLREIPGMGKMRPEAPKHNAYVMEASRKVAESTRTKLDVPYGNSYWHKIDVYLPEDTTLRDLPIFCMLHGGGFVRGYKEWMGFQAPVITSLPAIYISVSYRLAPEAKVPEITDDCLHALKLVYERAGDWGGDANRIFIGGHSAGAILVAQMALWKEGLERHSLPGDVIKGCFPVAGVYNLDPGWLPADTILATVFPDLFDDAADAINYSPLNHVIGNTTPFMVCWGNADTQYVLDSSEELVAALSNQPGLVKRQVWEGYNHFDAHRRLENIDNPMVVTLRDWMQNPAGLAASDATASE
tara:strand:+ start:774 stop:1691 length:918 start_codon:yes stop_codon:yes gene_type:complete